MAKSTFYLPDGLPQRAHAVGINVSRVAANAVKDAVEKLEKPKDTGAHAAKQNSPAVGSVVEGQT